jgi:translocation and assembly module TamB
LPEPATLKLDVHRNGPNAAVERLEVRTPFLSATGQGDLDSGVAVAATVDLGAFRERFRDWIDLGAIVLAGQGELDASFRRSGPTYQARLGGTFRRLRIDGLAVVSKFERDQLTFDSELSGPLAHSGWPLDWSQGSLRVQSEPAEVHVQATNRATGKLAMSARAHTELTWNDRRRRVEGELKATWDQSAWTADRITLAVIPLEAGQPRGGNDRAIRWAGKGRFDRPRDELVIESAGAAGDASTERDFWLGGSQRLHVQGLTSPASTQIDAAANVDIASVGGLLAAGAEQWGGQLESHVRARTQGDRWDMGIRVELRDPKNGAGSSSPVGQGGSVVLGVKASYKPGADQLDLAELGLRAPYIALEGAGVVRDLTSRPEVELQGELSPDWDAIRTLLAQKVEPNARIAGRPRAWRISGPIASVPAFDRLGSLQGELGVQIDALDVFGMRISDVPVVARAADGRLRIEPIDGSLNGGPLHLEPELVHGKNGSIWLHLGPESRLTGAIINDEVSHRVLSYVAPVLDGATRVQGRVSVEMADAVLPIAAGPDEFAMIKGNVLFDNVRFMPGPLADQLLSVFQKERKPLAVIRDPISVRITGRKVYQEGLVIPVAKVASIGVDGSVDFDRKLDLVARFALNAPQAPVPVLSPILESARFELPIRGTLDKPKVDGAALKERWKSVGIDFLGDTMEAGVNGVRKLLEGLSLPRLRGPAPRPRRVAPPAPPRPADPDSEASDGAGDRQAGETTHEVRKPPARSAERTKQIPAERRQVRERRKQERLQKKAGRQAKRSETAG